jgi:hypothetical protein
MVYAYGLCLEVYDAFANRRVVAAIPLPQTTLPRSLYLPLVDGRMSLWQRCSCFQITRYLFLVAMKGRRKVNAL